MSVIYLLTTIIWTSFSVLEFLSAVTAETCPSGLECNSYEEYCCSDGCCSRDSNYGYGYGYGFYNLWYFWFVIIMIMMTCCGACSYVKKRQYYMRQQQSLGTNIHPTTGAAMHHPPTTYGVHQSHMGPPVGTFPGPPAYSEVTEKPDQFPKANGGYPNYGFAAPPYSHSESTPITMGPAPPLQSPSQNVPTACESPSVLPPPATAAMAYPPPQAPSGAVYAPPATSLPASTPTSAPPPYTPIPPSTATATSEPAVLPVDQGNSNA